MVPSKNLFQNLGLVVFGFVLAFLLAEFVLRIVYNPVDYLRAEPKKHKILGHKLEPGQAGHDDWGFRNSKTLSECDILVIGDSQTYGVSAKASESWPAQLAQLSNKKVYNLSLGGYGPLEYLHLLNEYKEKIRFEHLIVAFYTGNDLADAYRSAYSIDYNEAYRSYPFDSIERRGDSYAIYNMREVEDRSFKNLRVWLANNSITYRLLTHSGIGDFVRRKELKEDDDVCFAVDGSNRSFLTPKLRISTIDLEEPKVEEGWRITKKAMLGIKQVCSLENLSFTVLVIPTKEMVHARTNKEGSCEMMNVLEQKSTIFYNELDSFFNENHINWTWAIKGRGESNVPLYPEQDSHPNKNGYKRIAKNVLNKIGE